MVQSTIAISKQINDIKGRFIYKALLDHGGSHVIIKKSTLPKNVELFSTGTQNFTTAAGSLMSYQIVFLHDVVLPEFSYSRRVKTVKVFVFDNDAVQYDIFFGRSFLNTCRIDVLSSSLTCQWYSDTIPFHDAGFFANNDRIRSLLSIPPARVQQMESHQIVAVTETKETRITVEEVISQQDHLSEEQKMQLLGVMNNHQILFDGKLGTYPKRKFHIELKDDAVPYHCKQPYSVAAVNMPVLKKALDRQENMGIIKRVGESEWGMPMMVIPKKDGAIRTIDDFRELNKHAKRKTYSLPKIQDIFHRRKGYKYATKIDLTLCYYTFELDEESS
jgi:hypothetical protein